MIERGVSSGGLKRGGWFDALGCGKRMWKRRNEGEDVHVGVHFV